MTEPTRVGDVLPGVVAEAIARAGPGYERWAELVAQAGYCHHPIRLAGRVEQADRTTGEVRTVDDSDRVPDVVPRRRWRCATSMSWRIGRSSSPRPGRSGPGRDRPSQGHGEGT